MIRFRRIEHRLLTSVGAVVIVGMIALSLSFAVRQEAAAIKHHEQALGMVTDSVAEGLTALMLGRHWSAAPDFANRLTNVPNVVDYRLVRLDGTQAFIDNRTLESVRQRLGKEFEYNPRRAEPVSVFPASSPGLESLRMLGERVFDYREHPGGERTVTVFSPIRGGKDCGKCHEHGAELRGAVTLTASMGEIDRSLRQTWQFTGLVITIALVASISLIYWFAHRTVVTHLSDFRSGLEALAAGDDSVRLQARSRDEVGAMAHSFNYMNQQLLETYTNLRDERNKLNTVILGASSGIVITDATQQIVLVNPAAERLLGRSRDAIVARGFATLLDDPDWMLERMADTTGTGAAKLFERDGRILSVRASTIRNQVGEVIGSTALIRDITEEKRLEERLRAQSVTDTLTGLFNRRHFDGVLTTEFLRWQRYRTPLSVMMIDVDHFKRFNDTHGHECGDNVLAAIGAVLRELGASDVIPCRYGGEELVIVAPGLDEAAATALAEQVRERVAALVIDGLNVTVSIGVAGLPDASAKDGESLLKLADTALYTAKESGRNRVCRTATA